MIKAIVSDFSRVILFPKDITYLGSLNALHKELSVHAGYNPLDYFDINTPLLDFYAILKKTVSLYIFTSDTIQDAPEFQPYLQSVFHGVLSAKKMNTDKKLPEAYRVIAAHLHFHPTEIAYIDDASENIQAAKSVGLTALLYKDVEDTQKWLDQILNP